MEVWHRDGDLWRQLLCAKYELSPVPLSLHRICLNLRRPSRYVFDIIKVLLGDSLEGRKFRDLCFCAIGRGLRVSFWLDAWAATKPLALLYPRLFSVTGNQEALVADVGSYVLGSWVWSIQYRRNLFEWEAEMHAELLYRVSRHVPSLLADTLLWLGDQNGQYTVKRFCEVVELDLYGSAEWCVPSAVRKVVPPKAVLFLWQATENKIAVMENLQRRGVVVDAEGACVLCGRHIESVDHLFLFCDFAAAMWNKIMCREGVVWCMPGTLLSLIQEWDSFCRVSDTLIWRIIPYALIWSIWLARNGVIFKGEQASESVVWDLHITRLFWWLKASNEDCPYTVVDFSQNLQHVSLTKQKKSREASNWSPPPPGILKFNVDGAARGAPGLGGMGGVLRDSRGVVVGRFSMSLGHVYAFEAEVSAILQALKFCKQFGVRGLLIESDASLAVGWVNNDAYRPWKLLNDLQMIDHLSVEVGVLNVSHIYRESNGEADGLAKEGCDRIEPLMEFESC